MTDKAITRIYAVKEDGKPTRLVRAPSQASAVRHVTKPRFGAEVATPDELVEMTLKGVKIEEAKAD